MSCVSVAILMPESCPLGWASGKLCWEIGYPDLLFSNYLFYHCGMSFLCTQAHIHQRQRVATAPFWDVALSGKSW